MKRRALLFAVAFALSACRGGTPGPLPAAPNPLGAVSPATVGSIAFVPIGPTHMTSGGFPNSGKVNAVAVDPKNPKIIYTASGRGTGLETYSSAGIYRTTDGGRSWTPAVNGLTDQYGFVSSVVNSIWLDPSDSSSLLAATEYDGIFRSGDRGSSWHNVYGTAHATQFALTGNSLFASTDAGILRSNDRGRSWNVSLAATPGQFPTAFGGAESTLYAGMSNGAVFGLDGGRWVKLATLPFVARTGTEGSTPAVHQIAVDPTAPSTLYVSTNDGRWDQDLFASTDGGKTFKKIVPTYQKYGYYQLGLGTQAIAFSQVHPHSMYVGLDGFIASMPGDGSKKPSLGGAANLTVIDIRNIWPSAHGADDACWIASDQGLDYEPACSTYAQRKTDDVVSSTLATGLARRFVVSPDGKTILVSIQDFDSHATYDGGRTWHENYNARERFGLYEDGFNELSPGNPRTCYAFDESNGFTVSNDGCRTYASPSTMATHLLPSRLMTTPLAFDPLNPKKIYVISGAVVGAGFPPTDHAVFVTADNGATFQRQRWPLKQPGMIAVDRQNGSHILVGDLGSGSTIHVTFNGGKTWMQSVGVPPTGFWYSATISPLDGWLVLASSVDAANNVFVLRSTDGGKTFRRTALVTNAPLLRGRIDSDLAQRLHQSEAFVYSPARQILFNQDAKTGNPDVVVTTLRGAYLSTDLGATWQRLDGALISHSFWGIRWNGGYLYLATDGQGIVKSTTALQ
jgi:photosystem II stability/assembly factor-like uncharacterized protein